MSKLNYDLNKTSIGLLKNKAVIPTDQKAEELMAGTVQAHFMQWGYMLSEEAFQALEEAPRDFIIDFYSDAMTFFAETRGGQHNYEPLFKGFPEEVIEASDFKLFRTRMGHYWSGGKWSPGEKKKYQKPIEFEHTTFEPIVLADEKEFKDIFRTLVSSGNSLTPVDFAIIDWFAENYDDLLFPERIPFKENLCALAARGLDVPVKTPTDVLRIATHMSGGDISLPSLPWKTLRKRWGSEIPNPAREDFKFKKFSRAERRFILSLLEKTHCRVEEMVLHKGRWIRLGEILHPGDYADKFPRAMKAFDRLRNEKVTSWYGKLEKAMDKSLQGGLSMLAKRPGEFARRIDALLRHHDTPEEHDEILSKFEEVADRVSNKVLFELLEHFEKRTSEFKRHIMVKGGRKKIDLPKLDPMSEEIVVRIASTVRNVLRKKFASLEDLGKVYIDPELQKIGLPKNMRSLSPGLKPVIRGQRIPFELKSHLKTVRAFVHWFNDGTEYCDIDLSGVLFDENGSNVVHVGWNGRYNEGNACVYSGDITNRKGACAEYIDFNVDALVLKGFDYAVIDLRDYAGKAGGIAGYQDCVFGVMERTNPKANKTWKPDSIQNAHQLTTPARGVLAAGIDLKNREYFMIDLDREGHVVSQDISGVIETAKSVAEEPDFSVFDLLTMHGDARGEIVEDKDEAETVWNFDDFMVSYEKIIEYMGV